MLCCYDIYWPINLSCTRCSSIVESFFFVNSNNILFLKIKYYRKFIALYYAGTLHLRALSISLGFTFVCELLLSIYLPYRLHHFIENILLWFVKDVRGHYLKCWRGDCLCHVVSISETFYRRKMCFMNQFLFTIKLNVVFFSLFVTVSTYRVSERKVNSPLFWNISLNLDNSRRWLWQIFDRKQLYAMRLLCYKQ